MPSTLLLLAASEQGHNMLDDLFDVGQSSFLWTLLIFGVSLPLLWKLVFGPILRAMEERETEVRDAAEAAERAREETESLRASVQRELESARQDAAKQLADAKRRAAAREQELMAAAKAEAEKERQRARADVEHAVRSARETLRRDAVALSVEIAERVIGRQISAEDQQRLIEEFADEAQLN